MLKTVWDVPCWIFRLLFAWEGSIRGGYACTVIKPRANSEKILFKFKIKKLY